MSKFLHEYLYRDNYEVLDQYVLWDMFSYNPEYNPKGRRQPTLRPDFVIKENGRIISLLDAKYRDLWETPLPTNMLYQLAVYAFSGRWSKSKILYPTLHESAKIQKIDIRDPVTDGLLAQVILQPVLLNYIVELIDQRGKYKEACDYAYLLAFEESKDKVIQYANKRLLFLSSANLTEYAFTVNMELGVLIQGGNLPSDIVEHFDKLIEEEVLVPLG
jgi:hypothetical protein